MQTLPMLLTVGVLGLVFGLAFATALGIVAILLYVPVHDASDHVLGWRDLTCPQLHKAARVRLSHAARSGVRVREVVRCSVFGGKRPACRQACLKASRFVAVA